LYSTSLKANDMWSNVIGQEANPQVCQTNTRMLVLMPSWMHCYVSLTRSILFYVV